MTSLQANRKTMVLRVIFTLCTIATILFIFSNSMQEAAVSGARSGQVTAAVNTALEKTGVSVRVTEHFVRKLGHLTEYMLLGFFLMLTLRIYTQRVLSHISWPLFFSLAVPLFDESIQLFSKGRSAEVRDVLIDFGGAVLGLLCALFLLLMIRMFRVLRQSKTPL